VSRLVLASRNHKKLEEMRRILDDAGLHLEVVGIDAFDGVVEVPEVPETEGTFEGNALLKARAVSAATGVAAVADDSGLCVDTLAGMPGILSARWSGGLVPGVPLDEANVRLVLAQVADVPDERLGAQFRCAVALVLPDGHEHVVQGEMRGRLVRAPRGEGGFGYDPIFVADGHDVTNAELSRADKDAISHRGHALRALVPHLRVLVAQSSL
jgi:XTP/dITP diphosphohydrolase